MKPASLPETALVDLPALAAWMDRQGVGEGPIVDVRPLKGGTQNVLLQFRRGEQSFVLRRPPQHPRMNGNETMRREARVLRALGGTNVPHPCLIAACSDESVLGAAFYLMEPVNGFNANVALPAPFANDASLRHRMGLSLIEGLAALGNIDHVAVGLADFGKPANFLKRQVNRWRSLFDSYREFEGWPGGGDLPGFVEVGDWLERNCPQHFTPGVMHGDYHLANVLFRHDAPELAGIVDWELATIGDPLCDLGWVLGTWPDPAGPTIGTVGAQPWDGFPAAAELVAHYAKHSSRDVSRIDWYAVLGCYKLGVVNEGTFARACAGKAPHETGSYLHRFSVALFQRANRLIHACGTA